MNAGSIYTLGLSNASSSVGWSPVYGGSSSSPTTTQTTTNCVGDLANQTGFTTCAVNTNPTGTTGGTSPLVFGANTSSNNYNNNLFAGTAAGTGTGTLGKALVNQNASTSLSATDPVGSADGVTFATAANPWSGSGGSTGTTSITMAVGLYGVASVWTMLNDTEGINGNSNTWVTFNFGSASNSTTYDYSVTFKLVNGQQIRDSMDCSAAGNTINSYTCASFGRSLSSTAVGGTTFSGPLGTTAGTVAAYNVTNTTYSNTNSTRGSYYYNTTGTAVLDEQVFSFNYSMLATEWLVNMTVSNVGGSFAAAGLQTSRTILSAVSAETGATTPEPSSIALIAGGIGALAWIRRRRQA